MKERPILFSGRPMVRAILDGSKTQTRRIVSSRLKEHRGCIQDIMSAAVDIEERAGGIMIHGDSPTNYDGEVQMNDWNTFMPSPHGEPGDRLWVREAFNFAYIDYLAPGEVLGKSEEECVDDNHGFACVCGDGVMYRADGEREHPDYGRALWKPSIFMPRWASRITLEIESIRVERLQDISVPDAIAEGCPLPEEAPDYVGWYRDLWNSINGTGSWDANPWVWVVTFNRLKP